nr:helix-turn-helix transcriptional regulator [Niabella ginsengisoli]
MLLKINESGFSFFYDLPVEDRSKYAISYDFNLKQPHGNLILVNHKLKPLLFDRFHNPWIALCIVSISSRSEPGNIRFTSSELKKFYELDLKKKEWKEKKNLHLNKREKEVLLLSAQGLTMKEIAYRLAIDINTVKFHKRTVFSKLKVKSISEAITASMDLALL